MSSKSQLYPLSRTGNLAGNASRASWSTPLRFGKNKLIHSQLMYGTRSWPLGEFSAHAGSEASRNHRDMLLGLALAFSVSATFWTGVGLLVACILR